MAIYEVSMTNEEKVKVTATPETGTLKPLPLNEPVTVSITSGNGTFTQDPTEPSVVYLVSSDAAGDTVYVISGTSGEVTVSSTVTAHVAIAVAANLKLEFGTPEAK